MRPPTMKREKTDLFPNACSFPIVRRLHRDLYSSSIFNSDDSPNLTFIPVRSSLIESCWKVVQGYSSYCAAGACYDICALIYDRLWRFLVLLQPVDYVGSDRTSDGIWKDQDLP